MNFIWSTKLKIYSEVEVSTIDETIKIKFIDAFNKVFDREDHMKICPQEYISELIDICNEIDSKGFYGSKKEGFLQKGAVINLRNKIKGAGEIWSCLFLFK